VAVSRRGADPRESAVAARARGLHRNSGRVTDVAAMAPDLVVTSRGDPAAALTARRLGMTVLELPEPRDLAGVRRNIRAVASALGRVPAGAALVARMDAALVGPPKTVSALMVGGGGNTPSSTGLTAAWLRGAGLALQDVPQGRISLERLLSNPPQVLLTTRYHPGSYSSQAAWLAHPALRRLPASTARRQTDGRVWICGGPSVADEITGLRQ
ncbi:ABC transporter substrate-binding protein, partial [Sandarakinorhabdus sp.]|uniref:ABC transporter substrate-binding protein n=1 Tax=Sandarakinorhabdus sp. TaxID=1916663 RepID=UPI0038F6C1A8